VCRVSLTVPIDNSQLTALVNHLAEHAPRASFNALGTVYSVRNVVSLARSLLAARAAVVAAQGKLKDARAASANRDRANVPILNAVRLTLVARLAHNQEALAALAVSTRKAPRALTTEARLTATEKMRATRAARGTLGKTEKAKIKGNVTRIVVTRVMSSGVAAASPAVAAGNMATATSPPRPLAGFQAAPD
jgi:hypothetical protein